MLEGSVQRDQSRVRVNAQLIDAESGAHLWAERFEEDVADLFKLQDQVVARLANTLGIELVKAEAEKGARSKNPDAIDLTMRGWALVESGRRKPKTGTTRRALCSNKRSRSTRTMPDALAGEAYTYVNRAGERGREPRHRLRRKNTRVRLTGPSRSLPTHCGRITRNASTSTIRTARTRRSTPPMPGSRSIQILVPLKNVRAIAEVFLGRFEEAKSDIVQAMRLKPARSSHLAIITGI